MKLRQMEPKEVIVSGTRFYIKPFPAFKSANLTGELAAMLTPILSALAPLIDASAKDKEEGSLMDIDVKDAAPSIAKSFDGLSGDKVEMIMKKLLVQSRNIVVEISNEETGETEQEILNEDLVNEIFCGEVQDMFILAFEVIRLNFNGFFKKTATLFGKVGEVAEHKMHKIF